MCQFTSLLTEHFDYFSFQGGKEVGTGVPKEGPVVDFNGIRCILYSEFFLYQFLWYGLEVNCMTTNQIH